MTLGETIRSRPKSFVLPVALVLAGLVGVLDYFTRWEISFFVAYAIPIFLVGWIYPKSIAFGFAILCAAVAWAVNLPSVPSMSVHAWPFHSSQPRAWR